MYQASWSIISSCVLSCTVMIFPLFIPLSSSIHRLHRWMAVPTLHYASPPTVLNVPHQLVYLVLQFITSHLLPYDKQPINKSQITNNNHPTDQTDPKSLVSSLFFLVVPSRPSSVRVHPQTQRLTTITTTTTTTIIIIIIPSLLSVKCIHCTPSFSFASSTIHLTLPLQHVALVLPVYQPLVVQFVFHLQQGQPLPLLHHQQ